MEQIMRVFRTLKDETGIKVLKLLLSGVVCTKGISRHLEISEAEISRHLKALSKAGVIMEERKDIYVCYNLQRPVLVELMKYIRNMDDETLMKNCKLGIYEPDDCKAPCDRNREYCFMKREWNA